MFWVSHWIGCRVILISDMVLSTEKRNSVAVMEVPLSFGAHLLGEQKRTREARVRNNKYRLMPRDKEKTVVGKCDLNGGPDSALNQIPVE